jgi:hypothetical protein
MKTLIWTAFLVLTLLWSGFWWLANQLTGWLLAGMASGQINGAVQSLANMPLPPWIALWVDPAWLEGVQSLLVPSAQWLVQVLPNATGLLDWISPLFWTAWTLGMLTLLALALAGHWMINRRQSHTGRTVRAHRY